MVGPLVSHNYRLLTNKSGSHDIVEHLLTLTINIQWPNQLDMASNVQVDGID
jgi:hypothetical protein